MLDEALLIALGPEVPAASHLHGILEESFVLGDGDLHFPSGWGAIPLTEVFAIPFPRTPIVILELHPHFREHVAAALGTTLRLLDAQANEPTGGGAL